MTEIVIERLFDAPRLAVWEAWTQPEKLKAWWGPREFPTPVVEIDPRPGGAYRFVMRGPDGLDYPMHGTFETVAVGELLSFNTTLKDHPDHELEHMAAKLDEHGAAPDFEGPLTVVTFADAGEGTKVTITLRFRSDGQADAYRSMGVVEGWGESLDKLEELLRP